MAEVKMFGSMANWWKAVRYHFVPPSFLPVFVGTASAYHHCGEIDFLFFLLTLIAVVANHIGLNMTDDYFDLKHAVDVFKDQDSNPYSGGSGTLTSGEIKPRSMLMAFSLCYAVTVLIGAYLVYLRGPVILFLGLFGIFSAFFYTAPPVKYGYRGLGEVSQLLNFSLVIGLGSYYVQTGAFSFETAMLVLPLGFLMFAMITINEMPDYKEDKTGGKNNLVVKLGRKRARYLYVGGILFAYVPIITLPFLDPDYFPVLISLITVPLAWKAVKILFQHYRSPVKMAPANVLTIKMHNEVGFILFITVSFAGMSSIFDIFHAGFLLVMFILFYFPVFVKVYLQRDLF